MAFNFSYSLSRECKVVISNQFIVRVTNFTQLKKQVILYLIYLKSNDPILKYI